jgi:hypothetical protein
MWYYLKALLLFFLNNEYEYRIGNKLNKIAINRNI